MIEAIAKQIHRGVDKDRIVVPEEIKLRTIKYAVKFVKHIEKTKEIINSVSEEGCQYITFYLLLII